MKWLVWVGLALALFVAGLMVGCDKAKREAAVAYSRLAHQHDAAVAELVSARQVAADVPILRDSIAHYRGQALASARVEIRRDTLQLTDTLFVPGGPADSLTSTVAFPPLASRGVTVFERLGFDPPIGPTRIQRWLGIAIDPDTVSVVLLRTPDGLQRFIAQAEREGVRLNVVDAAALAPPAASRFGVGCAAGPSLTAAPTGDVRAGLGISCGISVRLR